MSGFYWERHPDGPFATLIAVAATYCSPDAYDGAYDDLISRARAPDPGDEEIRAFKAELQQALADPGQLPGDELFDAVDYGDGSDEAFLRRLWHDLYGDQPCSGGLPDPAPADRADPDMPGQRRAIIVPWMRRTTRTWPGGCTACSSGSRTGWTARTRGSCTTSSKSASTAWPWRKSPARSPRPRCPSPTRNAATCWP